MVEIALTQAEANTLIAMEKHRANDECYDFPMGGESLILPLRSPDGREHFLLDLNRSHIDLLKVTFQNRARQVIVLVRLDLGGPPHRNPDGEEIPTPHLHIYREGYGDKWAIPVPPEHFSDTSNPWIAFKDFMRFCNITRPPRVKGGLF